VELKLLVAHPSTSVKVALCDYVNKIKPDMLICGSRGMNAMGRILIGSVSDYLVHNSCCSTLIVKTDSKP